MQCPVNWVISSFLERHWTIISNLNWHTSLWNGLQCEIYSRQQNNWLPKIYQVIIDGMTLPALSRWSNHSSASSTFTMRCSGAYMFEKLHACVPKQFKSLKDIVTWWTQEKSYCSVCAMASSEGSCDYCIQTWYPYPRLEQLIVWSLIFLHTIGLTTSPHCPHPIIVANSKSRDKVIQDCISYLCHVLNNQNKAVRKCFSSNGPSGKVQTLLHYFPLNSTCVYLITYCNQYHLAVWTMLCLHDKPTPISCFKRSKKNMPTKFVSYYFHLLRLHKEQVWIFCSTYIIRSSCRNPPYATSSPWGVIYQMFL